MNKKIILVGYGVAGKIHKNVLEKKGFECFVVEKDIQKTKDLANIHFVNLEDALKSVKCVFIFDICVDTPNHYDVLNQILSHVKKPNIIIEKPIVNKSDDLKDIERLVKNRELSIFVNENYLFLSSIDLIKELMQKHEISNDDIYIEFTKDRTKSKRFLDDRLLSAGLEGTHMLALLSMFFNLNELNLIKSRCSKKSFFADYSINGNAHAVIYSFLDGTKNFADKIVDKSDEKLRVLKLSGGNGKDIVVFFGSSRDLTTRIFVMRKDEILEEYSIFDDTMEKSLNYAIEVFENKKLDITFEKSVLFTKLLFDIVNNKYAKEI